MRDDLRYDVWDMLLVQDANEKVDDNCKEKNRYDGYRDIQCNILRKYL